MTVVARKRTLAGAVFGLAASLPFLILDALSETVVSCLMGFGSIGLVLGALIIQIREGLGAMRHDQPVIRPVATATGAFLTGAVAVFFLVLIPAASILGSFDWLNDFPGPQWGWGPQLFLLATVSFAVPAFVSGLVVVAVTATVGRLQRRGRRLTGP
jgi:hypothetical protein